MRKQSKLTNDFQQPVQRVAAVDVLTLLSESAERIAHDAERVSTTMRMEHVVRVERGRGKQQVKESKQRASGKKQDGDERERRAETRQRGKSEVWERDWSRGREADDRANESEGGE